MPTWEDDADEYAALDKQGKDWRLMALVACSVEKGTGGPRTVANATVSKVSARMFAERAGTQASRILRHLAAYDALVAKNLATDRSKLLPGMANSVIPAENAIAEFEAMTITAKKEVYDVTAMTETVKAQAEQVDREFARLSESSENRETSDQVYEMDWRSWAEAMHDLVRLQRLETDDALQQFLDSWCAQHSHQKVIGRGEARRAIESSDVAMWLRVTEYVASQNRDIEPVIKDGATQFDWPAVGNDGLKTAATKRLDWKTLVAKNAAGKPKTRRDIRADVGIKTGDASLAAKAIVRNPDEAKDFVAALDKDAMSAVDKALSDARHQAFQKELDELDAADPNWRKEALLHKKEHEASNPSPAEDRLLQFSRTFPAEIALQNAAMKRGDITQAAYMEVMDQVIRYIQKTLDDIAFNEITKGMEADGD